jgi:hypothetical protein
MIHAMENHNSFTQSEETFHEMMTFLANTESKHLDLSGIEEFLVQQGRTLCRQLLRAHLAERGIGDVGAYVIGSDGVKRTHKRPLKRTILTVFGSIVITRVAYSKPTISSLFPLDAMLNLPPHKISYTLQRHFVLDVIDRSFQKSSHAIARWTGVTITNRQAQAIVQDASQEFANFYDIRVMKEAEAARNLPRVRSVYVNGTEYCKKNPGYCRFQGFERRFADCVASFISRVVIILILQSDISCYRIVYKIDMSGIKIL